MDQSRHPKSSIPTGIPPSIVEYPSTKQEYPTSFPPWMNPWVTPMMTNPMNSDTEAMYPFPMPMPYQMNPEMMGMFPPSMSPSSNEGKTNKEKKVKKEKKRKLDSGHSDGAITLPIPSKLILRGNRGGPQEGEELHFKSNRKLLIWAFPDVALVHILSRKTQQMAAHIASIQDEDGEPIWLLFRGDVRLEELPKEVPDWQRGTSQEWRDANPDWASDHPDWVTNKAYPSSIRTLPKGHSRILAKHLDPGTYQAEQKSKNKTPSDKAYPSVPSLSKTQLWHQNCDFRVRVAKMRDQIEALEEKLKHFETTVTDSLPSTSPSSDGTSVCGLE